MNGHRAGGSVNSCNELLTGDELMKLKVRWTKIESYGSLPEPRHGHRTMVSGDRMVVYGGGNGQSNFNDLFVFSASTREWAQVPMPNLPERAGFGFALVGQSAYVFGGMDKNRDIRTELFRLNLSKWNWEEILPRPPLEASPPRARVGHSFTPINNQLILMFAGLSKRYPDSFAYLDDLYALFLHPDGTAEWELVITHGARPSPRDSHTACLYKPKDGNPKLIIYGGMCGYRLGDVWSLDINTYCWCEYSTLGAEAPPRSMHSAVIAGSRMFVFGGWSPVDFESEDDFMSYNQVFCLDLESMRWEDVREEGDSWNGEFQCFPEARTGHSMVLVNDKMYMWSGRTGSRYNDEVRVQDDLWCLEAVPGRVPKRIILANKSEIMIQVEWEPVPHVTHYILQIQVMPPASVVSPPDVGVPTAATLFMNGHTPMAQCVSNPRSHKSALVSFLSPPTLISPTITLPKTQSVTLMKTRDGKPVAMVPKTLIPHQQLADSGKPNPAKRTHLNSNQLRSSAKTSSNIIIISRRQSENHHPSVQQSVIVTNNSAITNQLLPPPEKRLKSSEKVTSFIIVSKK